MVKRQRRMVDTAIFLGPLVLTLAVALLLPSNLQTFQSLVFLGVEGLQGGGAEGVYLEGLWLLDVVASCDLVVLASDAWQ